MNYEEAINAQYGQNDLGEKILTILKDEGIETAKLIQDVIAPVEELHLRGRSATMELAQKVELNESMRVLDIGSGIGGPARTLVAEFGCYITGLDLCEEYCRAAEIINDKVGLNNKIEIRQGNGLDMPFDKGEFDIAFLQHVLMNIENKERLFSQISRVLRPKGRLALNTVCAGSITPIHFPVIWANNPEISFLLTASELRQLINNSGFREISWSDDTMKILEGIQHMRNKPRSKNPQPINLGVIVEDPTTKWRNIVHNLKEGRIVVIQGIFEKN
ncbi:MAG: class I SAM-dependent methyltransferase [Candidatus Hodarchaeota archaeon]